MIIISYALNNIDFQPNPIKFLIKGLRNTLSPEINFTDSFVITTATADGFLIDSKTNGW
jgi:hypothetical protein